MGIGKNLKIILDAKGLTIKTFQEDYAQDVKLNTLYAITKNDSSNIRKNTLKDLADALALEPDVLKSESKSINYAVKVIEESHNNRETKDSMLKKMADTLNIDTESLMYSEDLNRKINLREKEFLAAIEKFDESDQLYFFNKLNFLLGIINLEKDERYKKDLMTQMANIISSISIPIFSIQQTGQKINEKTIERDRTQLIKDAEIMINRIMEQYDKDYKQED